MASVGTDFVCCECKRISDPCHPPCEHFLCSSHEYRKLCCNFSQVEHKEVNSSLIYAGGSQIPVQSLQQEQVRQRAQQQPVVSRGANEEKTLCHENGTGENLCSNCQSQTRSKQIGFCHHCQRYICVHCHKKHRDSFRIMMRANCDILSCYKANLKAHKMEDKKGVIAAALEQAVSELRIAASKALDAAIAKVKRADLAGSDIISKLGDRITKLSTEVARIRDDVDLLNGMENSQTAVAKRNSLEMLLADAKVLKLKMKQILPLPITQIRLSNQFTKINRRVNEFDLFVNGETESPRCDSRDPRSRQICDPVHCTTLHYTAARPLV
ncbi:hypothetical protein TcWFU_010281 [Taenia crassiceps]|uniref:B box-type domain-containing protein n=1 Tax=Taenia crassiceps TaxID=6207 RepID=A0ABR4QA16_9CEST